MLLSYILFVYMNSPVGEEFISKLNEYRATKNADPVKENNNLVKAAELQANHESNIKECTHTGPSGNEHFASRFKNLGYENENISENVAQSSEVSADEVLEMWKKSPKHNKNMINPKYNETGIGYKEDDEGNVYWASTFGSGGDSKEKPGDEKEKSGDEKAKPGDKKANPGDEKAKPGDEKAKPGDEKAKSGDKKDEPGHEKEKPGHEKEKPGHEKHANNPSKNVNDKKSDKQPKKSDSNAEDEKKPEKCPYCGHKL